MTRRLMTAALIVAAAAPARSQEALLPSTSWGFGPVISAWHFNVPVPQSGLAIADVAQVSFPIRVRTMFGGRWSLDLSGAYVADAIHMKGSGQNGGDSGDDAKLVSGPTDLKLRLIGPVLGDAYSLTLGLNLPVGLTKLDAEQAVAFQAVASPAFRMPIGSFGTGAGGTVGLVRAFERGDWAFAVGGSIEQRTEYSPLAVTIAGSAAETKVTPGTALHLTFGANKAVGEGEWSTLVVADVFTRDKVKLGALAGGGGTSTEYTLGPQLSASTRYEFGGAGWREGGAGLALRYRSPFSDASGSKVSGSGATYLEASIGGVRGGVGGMGLVIGADARWQSGLKFTDALVGAAATVAGVSLGVDLPLPGAVFRFALHPQYGTFDTGTTQFTGVGGSIVFSFAARREAR